MTPRPALLEHQKVGVEWARRVKRGLLVDDPGLGKSRQAIEAWDGGEVLVVAPSMVLAGGTWTEELEKWANHPEKFTVVAYSQLNERERTPKGGSRPTDRVKPEFRRHWDAVVLDEAHYVKNPKTKWSKASLWLAKNTDNVELLTGTPVTNWPHELFHLLQVLRPWDSKPGSELGSYNRWVNRWFARLHNPFNASPGAQKIGGLLACTTKCDGRNQCTHFDDFVDANLGEHVLRRLRDDVLDLPPLTQTVVATELDPAQKRLYKSMKRDYLVELANGDALVAWTDGARNVALDKLTTSAWLLDPVGEPTGGKFETLRYDLEERAGQKTLVLAHYRDTVDACERVAQSLGLKAAKVRGGVSNRDKARAVQEFKTGDVQVLVGSLETLAEGLTLTQADQVIFVEKSFKPSRNEQAVRRVHRLGQTRPVTSRDYVTPGTVDERKRKRLQEKTDQQVRLLRASEYADLL